MLHHPQITTIEKNLISTMIWRPESRKHLWMASPQQRKSKVRLNLAKTSRMAFLPGLSGHLNQKDKEVLEDDQTNLQLFKCIKYS
jgi:hypothetical protein